LACGAFVLTGASEHDLIVHDIMEISYVPRGANRKEYLLVKGMKEDLFKSILETEDPELDKFLKENKIEGEAGEALVVVGKFLKSFKDKLPESTLSLMSKACGYPEPQPKKTDKAGQGGDGSGGQGDNGDPDEGAGDGCGGDGTGDGSGDGTYGYPSKKTLKMIEKMDPAAQELFKGLIQENVARKAEAQEATKLAKELKVTALKKEYMTKAEGLTHIPGISIAKMADDMMVMGEAHPEQFEELYKALIAADRIIEKSAAWESMGTAHEGHGGSTYQKILTMAKGLVQKSAEPMELEEAIDKVLEIHPEMYEQYEAEREAAAGAV